MLEHNLDMNIRFSHIVVSFLLLVGTTSLTVSGHYCAGELYSFRLFDNAPECCSDAGCGNCEDNSIALKLTDEYIVTDYQIKHNPLTIIKIYFVDHSSGSYAYNLSISRQTIFPFKTPPPGLKKSLSMIQSFIL